MPKKSLYGLSRPLGDPFGADAFPLSGHSTTLHKVRQVATPCHNPAVNVDLPSPPKASTAGLAFFG